MEPDSGAVAGGDVLIGVVVFVITCCVIVGNIATWYVGYRPFRPGKLLGRDPPSGGVRGWGREDQFARRGRIRDSGRGAGLRALVAATT